MLLDSGDHLATANPAQNLAKRGYRMTNRNGSLIEHLGYLETLATSLANTRPPKSSEYRADVSDKGK